jgi:rare lipoprotein A
VGAPAAAAGVSGAARRYTVTLLLLLGVAACEPRAPDIGAPAPPTPVVEQPSFSQSGVASWYGAAHRGRHTASGERFDPKALTAAHPTLALGTIARVTNLETGATVKVRINDRGPRARGRIIDLSAEAARALALSGDGVARVRVEVYASDQIDARQARSG